MRFSNLLCCGPSSLSNTVTDENPVPKPRGPEKPDKSKAKGKPIKADKFSAENVQTLFQAYADEDEPDVIGPENFARLCADADVPMDGALPLILIWYLDAKELGKIPNDAWTKGLDRAKISSLPVLRSFLVDMQDLLMTTDPIRDQKTCPYSQDDYTQYASDRQASFTKFYMSCFMLVKPPQSRNIEMETAVAFWSAILVPQFPLMEEVNKFITDKGTYKAVNKDVWSMMLEFCRTVSPNLDNYETEGAWPTMLDDFASWKTGGSGQDKPQEPHEEQD